MSSPGWVLHEHDAYHQGDIAVLKKILEFLTLKWLWDRR